jgi:hypothetical protein
LAQPPREAYDQDARHAWQEYGRVLVKVRRQAATLFAASSEQMQEIGAISARGCGRLGLQSRVENDRSEGRSPCNALKNMVLLGSHGKRPGLVMPATGKRPSSRCRLASKWRNLGEVICTPNREVHEECLSFVMPQQQGRPVAGHEDFR